MKARPEVSDNQDSFRSKSGFLLATTYAAVTGKSKVKPFSRIRRTMIYKNAYQSMLRTSIFVGWDSLRL
jgi:hypothetical protein